MHRFSAIWTGGYPVFCMDGRWRLFKDGKEISDMIPQEKQTQPMGTYGVYKKWNLNEDWDEVWEEYADGLKRSAWIEENNDWLSKIADNDEEKDSIFSAFQASDFRHGQCGGCI